MSSSSYASFQRALLVTDPRGLVVFTAPVNDAVGHVVAMAEALLCPIHIVPRDYRPSADFGADDVDTALISTVQHHIDRGTWFIIVDFSCVNAATWRCIGKMLFVLAPDDRMRGRAAFRLMTFVPEGTEPAEALPGIVMQTAFLIDGRGVVTSRSTLVPLFDGSTSMPRLSQLKTPFVMDGSNPLAQDNRSEYMALMAAASQSKLSVYLPAKQPATSPMYITDILLSLRDALGSEQMALMAEARKQDALEFQRQLKKAFQGGDGQGDGDDSEDPASSSLGSYPSGGSSPRSPGSMRGRDGPNDNGPNMVALQAKYDWVYHKILAWVVDQCPDADISAITNVHPDELSIDDVMRVSGSLLFHHGSWNGCRVLVKSVDSKAHTDVQVSERKRLAIEAARHFPLRHPQILALYGLGTENRLVMEHCAATVEQLLIQARFDNHRWTVKHFYLMTIQILQGMVFLATTIVHRDISCRSIVQTESGAFKVAEFGLALPVQHAVNDAVRGMIPVRWTAPEGFAGIFTPKSDVWSLGVLLWTALQYCTVAAYHDCHPPDALKAGRVLERPRECPADLWDQLVAPCLRLNPEHRPTALGHLAYVQSALRALNKTYTGKSIPFPTDEASFEEFAAKQSRGGLAAPAPGSSALRGDALLSSQASMWASHSDNGWAN